MGLASIPVDLLNPGQVFACLGLMEATEILTGSCKGRFAYQRSETLTAFDLVTIGSENPVEMVVNFLGDSEVVAIAPPDSGLATSKWGVKTEATTDHHFPAPVPDSPAVLPVRLRRDGMELRVEHWLDGEHCGLDSVKFWAGAGGYPGAALTRDAVFCLLSAGHEGLSRAV